jgi:hypothetical protein
MGYYYFIPGYTGVKRPKDLKHPVTMKLCKLQSLDSPKKDG